MTEARKREHRRERREAVEFLAVSAGLILLAVELFYGLRCALEQAKWPMI